MSTTGDNGGDVYMGVPGGPISLWDAATFKKAGLTPYNELKARYALDATALATDAEKMRQKLDEGQWQIIVRKCERGGLIKIDKEVTGHGGKGSVSRIHKLDEDTASLYIKGYTFMPWAYDEVRAKTAAELAEGREPVYSLKEIVILGEKNAKAAGAVPDRPKHFGSGKVYIVDSGTRSGVFADLPQPFPGTRKKGKGGVVPAHWEQVSKHVGDVYLYKEVGGEAKPYFTLKGRSETNGSLLTFSERIMLARISNKNEVLTLPYDDALMASWVNFDAVQPQIVHTIRINPVRAIVERIGGEDKLAGYPRGRLDDEFMETPDSAFTKLNGAFDGLTLVQSRSRDDNPVADDGEHQFTLSGQSFTGTCYIVRLGEGKRLAPLATAVCVGDVVKAVTFDTYDAVAKAKNQEPKHKPDAAFEFMDDDRWQDYFGHGKEGIYPFLYAEFNVSTMFAADREASIYNVLKIVAGKAAWNVPTLREIVERQKSPMEEAEAKAKVVTPDEPVVMEAEITEPVSTGGFPSEPDPVTVDATPDEPVTGDEPVAGDAEDETVDATPDEPVSCGSFPDSEPETVEVEILEPAYERLSHEEQELVDRELIGAVEGALASIDRRGVSILDRLNGDHTLRAGSQEFADDVRHMVDTARDAHNPLDGLVGHLVYHKGAEPKVAILHLVKRMQPSMTMADILSCYVETPTGKVKLFENDQPAA